MKGWLFTAPPFSTTGLMAQLPSDEYLKSEEFRKADEEYRRKIRQEKYGPPKGTCCFFFFRRSA